MNILNKLKLKTLIYGGFSIVAILLILLIVFVEVTSFKILDSNKNLSNEIIPNTLDFLELEEDIIQVQLWLTDISATRGLPGYDDGFTEAENYYKKANLNVDNLIEVHKNEPAMDKILKDLKIDLTNFYEMGINMAKAYIEGGPALGNQKMDEFETFAEKLTSAVNIAIEEHKKELKIVSTMNVSLLENLNSNLLIMLVVIIILMIIVSILSVKPVIKSLYRFIEIFKIGAEGDLTIRTKDVSKNEIGLLGQHFNNFMESLENMMQDILEASQMVTESALKVQDITEENKQASHDLSSASDELSATSSSLVENLNSTSEDVDSISSAVAESSSSIEEVVSSLKAISQNSNFVAKTTKDSANSAEEGNTVSNEAQKGMQNVKTQVTNIDGMINRLNNSNKKIVEILTTIKEIAGQTNMLSLNAAIEAARAGEAGKGFAVVADEVRALADKTTKATKHIEDMLTTITTEVADVVKGVAIAIKDVDAGNNLVTKTSNMLAQIRDGANKSYEMTNQTNIAIKEQETGMEEIIKAITLLREMVEKINAATDANKSSGEEIGEVSNSLSSTASHAAHAAEIAEKAVGVINKKIQALNDLVGNFKISEKTMIDEKSIRLIE